MRVGAVNSIVKAKPLFKGIAIKNDVKNNNRGKEGTINSQPIRRPLFK